MASTPAASASAATETRAPIDRLIAGGAAGALSRFTTAPIDRVKLLIQVNATSYRGGAPPPTLNPSSAWSVASRIAKQEGAVALWRGTGAAVVRILPYSATTFAVFPAYVDGGIDPDALHEARPAVDRKYVCQIWVRQRELPEAELEHDGMGHRLLAALAQDRNS